MQETKLTRGINMRRCSGYTVWATEAESQHRGGITIVWRDAEGWRVEGVRNFGPNVVSFMITSGRKCWHGVGTYVIPKYLPTTNWIRKSLECGPKGMSKLLVGNLNTCLENTRDQR